MISTPVGKGSRNGRTANVGVSCVERGVIIQNKGLSVRAREGGGVTAISLQGNAQR